MKICLNYSEGNLISHTALYVHWITELVFLELSKQKLKLDSNRYSLPLLSLLAILLQNSTGKPHFLKYICACTYYWFSPQFPSQTSWYAFAWMNHRSRMISSLFSPEQETTFIKERLDYSLLQAPGRVSSQAGGKAGLCWGCSANNTLRQIYVAGWKAKDLY